MRKIDEIPIPIHYPVIESGLYACIKSPTILGFMGKQSKSFKSKSQTAACIYTHDM